MFKLTTTTLQTQPILQISVFNNVMNNFICKCDTLSFHFPFNSSNVSSLGQKTLFFKYLYNKKSIGMKS